MGHRDELLRLFHIGVEDLEANRVGMLSQRQARYLRQSGIQNIILALILVGVLAAILFGVATKPLAPIQWILTGILSAIVLLIGYVANKNLRQAAADLRVECLTGPVAGVTHIRIRGHAGSYLVLAHRDFKLPAHQSDAPYRVYIAPKADCIVAMEPDGWN